MGNSGSFQQIYSEEDIQRFSKKVREYRLDGKSYMEIMSKLGISQWTLDRVFDYLESKPSLRRKCVICGNYFYCDNTLAIHCSEECRNMSISLKRGVKSIWKNVKTLK